MAGAAGVEPAGLLHPPGFQPGAIIQLGHAPDITMEEGTGFEPVQVRCGATPTDLRV